MLARISGKMCVCLSMNIIFKVKCATNSRTAKTNKRFARAHTQTRCFSAAKHTKKTRCSNIGAFNMGILLILWCDRHLRHEGCTVCMCVCVSGYWFDDIESATGYVWMCDIGVCVVAHVSAARFALSPSRFLLPLWFCSQLNTSMYKQFGRFWTIIFLSKDIPFEWNKGHFLSTLSESRSSTYTQTSVQLCAWSHHVCVCLFPAVAKPDEHARVCDRLAPAVFLIQG